MLLRETPAVLSLEKLCEEHECTCHWKSGQNPHLIKNGKRIDCNISNNVPFVVPGLAASSSSTAPSLTSPSSSSQDSVLDVNRYTENPIQERSGSTSEELRGDPLHESTENKIRNGEREEVQRDISHELPDWLQKFRENLVDESTSTEPWGNPEQGSQDTSKSSHELPMEPRAKVEPDSGTHSLQKNALSEGPKLWYLLEDENNRSFLQKTCWYSRAQSGKFWWLDNSRSQKPQWRKWIAQSSICRGGTRFGNAVDTIIPVQIKIIPGDGIIVRQHHTDQKQMGLLKVQCAEWKKGHLPVLLHGSIAQQPCRYFLKGTSTRTSCEYWRPLECQFCKNETGCKAGDKCLLPHYKVDEQPKKKPKKSNIPKRRESEDKGAVAIVKSVSHWVLYHKTRMHSLLKERKSFGEARCRKSWTQFEKFDSQSPRYVKRVSGKRKDHRWKKQKSFLVSEVLTLQNPMIGPTKRLDDNSDVPIARLWILPKKKKAQRERQGCILLACRKVGSPKCLSKRAVERESLWLIPKRVCVMVSEKDLSSAELATMRTSSGPITVVTANGEVRTNKKRRYTSNSWTYWSQLSFFEKLPQCFHWRNSAKNMSVPVIGKAVRILISSKMARELIAIYPTMYHLWFPGLAASSFSTAPSTYFSIIFITGFRIWCQQIHRNSSTRKKWKYEWRASGRPAAWIHRKQK